MSLGDGTTTFTLRSVIRLRDYHRILAPAKFPDLHEDDSIPPPATRENPGQVTHHVSLWEGLFAELLFARFIPKSTPLVSNFHGSRLPPFNVFPCHLATRNGPAGSHGEKELSPQRSPYGNPHHFQSGLQKLDDALNDVITVIEQEATNLGRTGNEDDLLIKFKEWRRELDVVRASAGDRMGRRLDTSDGVPAELGGIFTD